MASNIDDLIRGLDDMSGADEYAGADEFSGAMARYGKPAALRRIQRAMEAPGVAAPARAWSRLVWAPSRLPRPAARP